jgi:hypothetical protein
MTVSSRRLFGPACVSVPSGVADGLAHPGSPSAAFAETVQADTEGMVVRNWLNGQSFSEQLSFGLRITQKIMDGLIQ